MLRKILRSSRLMGLGLFLLIFIFALTTGVGAAGKAAPDFTLPDILSGKDYSLSQFKGKVVLINFITFFCMPCREEMPDLNEIYKEYKGQGLQVLGIGLSSDPVQLRFLVKQIGLDYPLLAGNDKVGKAYDNVELVPTTFIIDKQGNIAHKILGARKKADFIKLIQPLL
ncbi:MAG: TlpA disulfide reductase family protein [Syntrophales bacterium]|nr:TlpA disulfide reductase family protein [Syntrophales bacterium]MDD5643403.1 TlpA disulfide reductase family protein [Syntrophales bacterium]